MEHEKEEEDTFYSPERFIEEKDEAFDGDQEKIKLCLMRASVEKKDPSCKDIDDVTLRRFLRARALDVEKASSMFIRYLTWRRSFVPKGYISESEITNELAQNKMFIQGADKHGRPILLVYGSRHHASKQGVDELTRFLVFALDKLCQRMPQGQEKFMVICDLQGYGYCNTDLRGTFASISIFQEYYPERLGKAIIVHAPYVFIKMWKVINPFVDKKTRKKMVFAENKKLRETLLEDIDESQLPEIYGGKLQLVPIQNG